MSTTVARRYAQALIERAASASLIERVDDDVAMVRASLEGSRDLQLFFASPVISRSRKISVVQSLFADRVDGLIVDFISLLITKRREDLLDQVLEAYGALRDQSQGIASAAVRTARPLSDEDREALRKQLEAHTGLKLRMNVSEDADLLGGLVVRIGDTVYDGSVSGQLASLKERMSAGAALLN